MVKKIVNYHYVPFSKQKRALHFGGAKPKRVVCIVQASVCQHRRLLLFLAVDVL